MRVLWGIFGVVFSSLTSLRADVSVFVDVVDGEGSVEIVDPTGVLPNRRPASLQGIKLLGLDFVGRTLVDELRDDRPRLMKGVPAGWLRLPGEQGSLHRFWRRHPVDRTVTYGLFTIGTDGIARTVLELPGWGPGGDRDPFLPRLAVARDGRGLLVGTVQTAGGDLYEVDLAGSRVHLRTARLAPLALRTDGLALLEGWGAALTATGALRFERTAEGQATLVPFAHRRSARTDARLGSVGDGHGRPEWIGHGLVFSEDRTTVAFVAGHKPKLARVWTVRRRGYAEPVTDSPQHLSEPGFLPSSSVGPTLALSFDGGHVVYRVVQPASREVFVTPTRLHGGRTPIQLTGDEFFADTLNDSGVISFVGEDSLVLVVGEQESDRVGPIERGDLYRVDLLPGDAVEVTNVTATSGDTSAPFDEYGQLDTRDPLFVLPDAGAVAHLVDTGGHGHGILRMVSLTTGEIDVVAERVRGIGLLALLQRELYVDLWRNLQGNLFELYRTRPDSVGRVGSVELLLQRSEGAPASRWARGPEGRFAVLLPGAAETDLVRIAGPADRPEFLVRAGTFGPTMRFDEDGSLAVISVVGSERVLQIWPRKATAPLLPPLEGEPDRVLP